MTFSLVSSLSRSPSREQAAAVMTELTTILASDSFFQVANDAGFSRICVKHALAGDYDSLTDGSWVWNLWKGGLTTKPRRIRSSE